MTIPDAAPGRRVALFGGSFNPPHLSHALVVLSVLLTEDIDELWVLPCADHPFGKGLAPMAARLQMCAQTFAPLGERVVVSDLEADLPRPSYTVHTVEAIAAARPGVSLSWILGTDILPELHMWHEPEKLRALCDMIVIPRDGYERKGRLEIPIPGISSTEVRARTARGEDTSGLVAAGVAAFIAEHGLYKDA